LSFSSTIIAIRYRLRCLCSRHRRYRTRLSLNPTATGMC
jgi:hypothetical protein